MFDPVLLSTELVYTFLIVFFCFYVYYKTKEMYELTNYRGIAYFRNSFLFFGFAYLTRFISFLFQISLFTFDLYLPRYFFMPFMMTLTAYLSTIAIFYLAYSTSWKNISYKNFLIYSNIIAFFIVVISFLFRSSFVIALAQIPLLIITLINSSKNHKNSTKSLYFLITLFWLINMFLLRPNWFLPFELRLLMYAIPIIVFVLLLQKLNKWIK